MGIPISEARFSDNDALLVVSSELADRGSGSRARCLQSITISTLSIDTHAYCRPGFGAHYAFGEGNDFVVAYSGYASYNWMTENTRVVASSISIWQKDSRRLIALGELSEGSTVHQSSGRIVGDAFRRGRFMFFNVAGGMPELLLYDLSEVIPKN